MSQTPISTPPANSPPVETSSAPTSNFQSDRLGVMLTQAKEEAHVKLRQEELARRQALANAD
jgi:hypothetical protein